MMMYFVVRIFILITKYHVLTELYYLNKNKDIQILNKYVVRLLITVCTVMILIAFLFLFIIS